MSGRASSETTICRLLGIDVAEVIRNAPLRCVLRELTIEEIKKELGISDEETKQTNPDTVGYVVVYPPQESTSVTEIKVYVNHNNTRYKVELETPPRLGEDYSRTRVEVDIRVSDIDYEDDNNLQDLQSTQTGKREGVGEGGVPLASRESEGNSRAASDESGKKSGNDGEAKYMPPGQPTYYAVQLDNINSIQGERVPLTLEKKIELMQGVMLSPPRPKPSPPREPLTNAWEMEENSDNDSAPLSDDVDDQSESCYSSSSSDIDTPQPEERWAEARTIQEMLSKPRFVRDTVTNQVSTQELDELKNLVGKVALALSAAPPLADPKKDAADSAELENYYDSILNLKEEFDRLEEQETQKRFERAREARRSKEDKQKENFKKWGC